MKIQKNVLGESALGTFLFILRNSSIFVCMKLGLSDFTHQKLGSSFS